MVIARYPGVSIDCPDPTAHAELYGASLDWGVRVGHPFCLCVA